MNLASGSPRRRLVRRPLSLVLVVGLSVWTSASAFASADPALASTDTAKTTSSTATSGSPVDSPEPGVSAPVHPEAGQPPRRMALASPRHGSITLDGRLDEPGWKDAAPQGAFWQRQPHPGKPAEFRTQFRVLYDGEALYVGVRAFDPQPSLIRGLLTRRDTDSSSDWLTVTIDSYHDRRTAFGFSVNPAGVQRDVLHFNDIEQDPSWDAVWESAARVDAGGWTAEFRIPYSQLRFPSAREHEWGLQVVRVVQRTQETDAWSPWPVEAAQEVSLYGTVTGIRGIHAGRRIELLPYGLIGADLFATDAGDPVNDGHDAVLGGGLDFKVGLGSSFTVSGTINPDFGQVEADPSQVNLSANEIFFQEKRPFFVEGTEMFRYSLGQGDGGGSVESLFYSRRIGAPPHYSASDDYDFVNEPEATTIYGASKLTGKTAGGWSVGLLDAVTGQESAAVGLDDGTGDHERVTVEPFTNYAVAHVRKDFRGGRTAVGAAVTSVNRSLDGTGLDWLRDKAVTGGLEMNHRFGDDHWDADLRVAGSWVHGSAEAIDETQRSSVHFFQRPDATHLHYDPTRTSLTGTSLLWSIGKDSGGHWRFTLGGSGRTPGFEVNDLGFQHNSDFYLQWLWGQYRDDKPGRYLHDYLINLNGYSLWDTSPQLLSRGGNVNGQFNLLNLWGGGGGIEYDDNVEDPGGLRGGPMLRRDPVYNAWLNAWSDPRKPVNGSVSAFGYVAPASDSKNLNVSAMLTVQPRSNLDLSLGPSWGINLDDNQFVEEAVDSMGTSHYVMARIDQVTTALTLRVAYTYSPTLSFQLYAQPFVSAGRYGDYKEAVSPQARDYDDRYRALSGPGVSDMDGVRSVDLDRDGVVDYSFDLADFNFRQLRSNFIMRWEYRPGSTLFVIWSHGRTSSVDDGRFRLGNDLGGLAHEDGEHVVLAKLSYWFGV